MCPDCECPLLLYFLTIWQYSIKMCLGCECVLGFSSKLDWLAVLKNHMSSLWVCSYIKLVHWQLSLKMCSGCECVLALLAKFDWCSKCIQAVSVFLHFLLNLIDTGLQNVFRLWVSSSIFSQTQLANNAPPKCVQGVSILVF